MTPQEKRDKIRKTVDMVVPPLDEIDTTKVLSDEEQAELARRFEEAKTNKELAKKLGREGLKSVLRQSLTKAAEVATKLTQKFEKSTG